MENEAKTRWSGRLGEFLPAFLAEHAVLGRFLDRADAVLHGSTTFGFDDAVSDLDLWFLLPAEAVPEVDALSDTRFFEFELDGKEGHLTAESVEDFTGRLDRCDMITIAELRTAEAIVANLGAAAGLIERARKPMSEEVRRAFFFHHYVEMRGCHRSCDNPMVRRDAIAVLLTLGLTLIEALRAAMVLEGQPYPYEKWLRFAAARTPTGRRVCEQIETLLAALTPEVLRFPGRVQEHPVNLSLHAIRDTLIDAACRKGIDEPWLRQWWLHMTQAQAAIEGVRW